MLANKTTAVQSDSKSVISREEAFRLSEASVRLEGMDPTADPAYMALKARVLANEVTAQEAVTLFLARYKKAQTNAA
jgi:hypothetical protein